MHGWHSYDMYTHSPYSVFLKSFPSTTLCPESVLHLFVAQCAMLLRSSACSRARNKTERPLTSAPPKPSLCFSRSSQTHRYIALASALFSALFSQRQARTHGTHTLCSGPQASKPTRLSDPPGFSFIAFSCAVATDGTKIQPKAYPLFSSPKKQNQIRGAI